MIQELKNESNLTYTENGAVTFRSTSSNCLDFFAMAGGMRMNPAERIINHFIQAYVEDPDMAMKLLFYIRDIRGGMGERRIFRLCLRWLAVYHKESVIKNILRIPEFGRYDDLLVLMGTPCEDEAVALIQKQLDEDIACMKDNKPISLLGKWLPSINASNSKTRKAAILMAHGLHMSNAEYRKTLSALRKYIGIIENNLREKDYSFDYSEVSSKALFRYSTAFLRNDEARYLDFLNRVKKGEAKMNTSTLAPYEIIHPIISNSSLFYYNTQPLDENIAASLNTTWNAQEDFTDNSNSLVVVDGSGSMYGSWNGEPMPIEVALSLGIYFAERNKGEFKDHFITFSHSPRLIEIKGKTIVEKVEYCMSYNEMANTNIAAVFDIILKTAVKNNIPHDEMPAVIYIVSDMEFDVCADDADITNFEHAKRSFEEYGYSLPQIVFWNVRSRHDNVPVKSNEQGVILVSGCSPRVFSMVKEKNYDPYSFMLEALNNERYSSITA